MMEEWTYENRTLRLVCGDITHQTVDAIVNAANSRLAGGGGVDGAIHRRGGPSILHETREKYPHGCPTGSAVVSSAGDLAAKYVIHAVGPRWSGGENGEREELRSAYQTCFELATSHGCQSIALPSLSTGAYAYPVSAASHVALKTCMQCLKQSDQPALVLFVLVLRACNGRACSSRPQPWSTNQFIVVAGLGSR